ncbi:MAG: MarR family transcriptional regulator [Clostridia bacterium]|nr:MarR family transcriptional regulator [Clostridia bacterium]
MKTIEEEIVRMLGRLNALSKRGSAPPPSPPETRDGEPLPPPPPDPAPRGQGRGRMLGLLLDHGEMSQSHLAYHLGIRPQSLSEMLAKAEADGMIVRRQSTEDKRQTLVSLTELGQSRVETFRENHRRQAAEFLAPLTDEEKAALADILRKLIDAKKEDEN